MVDDRVDFDVLAHDKASDNLDKIGRAFKKVGKDADSIGKNTKGLEKLSREFEKHGEKSGKGFSRSLKRWFGGGGALGELGKSGGTVFGSGFLGALKTPILGPAIVGILGGLVATVLPAVGAVAGGALVAGFGAGIAGLGIVFAAKSEAVGRVWSKTMSQLGADMRLLSKPFEGTLISIAAIFERTVDRFNPALGKAFAKMAPMVTRFVDGAARSLEQLVPAIGPITDAFGDVLDSLGPALQSAVGDLSDGMTKLSVSISKNPDGLADFVVGLGAVVGAALELIRILNDVNGSFEELTGGLSLVDVTMSLIVGPITFLSSTFAALGKGIDLVNAAFGRTGKDVGDAGASMSKAANDTVLLAQGLQKTQTATKGFDASLQTVTDALSRQKLQFSAGITAMGQWTSNAIGASNAAIGYQASLDAATASLKTNGKTLDIGTEKGRANRTALNQIAEAANRQTQAMDEAGASNVTVARTAEKSRANFVKLAMQMGATKPQAEAMAKSMINIPNVSRTAKLNADKRDLEKKLASANAALKNPNLTKTRTAALKADKRNAEAGIARINGLLNGLPGSKTITIRTRQITERLIINQTASGGGRAPRTFAHGGPVKANVPIIVGDGGRPELFVPESNGVILPKVPGSTGPAAAGVGGGGRVVLEFRSDGSPHMDYLMREVRKYVKIVGGGNVQQAFGANR